MPEAPLRAEAPAAPIARADAARAGDLPDVGAVEAPSGWLVDPELAFEEAQRRGRPVFVDFTAAWCIPCRLLEHDTLSHPDVRSRLAAGYVALRVDVTEETASGRAFAARFRARRLPTLLVLSGDGGELARIESYLDAESLLTRLAALGPPSR